jgi:hypothetical protein
MQFMHMVDALETAGAAGLTIRPRRPDEPKPNPPMNPLVHSTVFASRA